jgi:hypothetical protein
VQRQPKKKRRVGFQTCLAVLKQNVLDLKRAEKPSEAVPSEALVSTSEAVPSEAVPSEAGPSEAVVNARVLGNKYIIIFVSV